MEDDQNNNESEHEVESVTPSSHISYSEQATAEYFESRFNALKAAVDAITKVKSAQAIAMDGILKETTRLSKFLEEYLKYGPTPNVRSDGEVADENFEDFENLKFMSTDDLTEFEMQLQNKDFATYFSKYLGTLFKMNGTQCGKTFFSSVMVRLSNAGFVTKYSWIGISRGTSENVSFKHTHKVFVSFMTRMVRLADKSKSADEVEGMFRNFLRFKNQRKKRGENCQVTPKTEHALDTKTKKELESEKVSMKTMMQTKTKMMTPKWTIASQPKTMPPQATKMMVNQREKVIGMIPMPI